jgi:uncharacterized protein (DUF1684 family)
MFFPRSLPGSSSHVRHAAAAAVLAVAVACGSVACGGKSPQDLPYSEQISADRNAKNTQFASAADSPVPADKRGQFLPLGYYAPDEGYRVPAMLAPFEGEEAIEMPTSTGKRREMRRAGQLKFSVKGQTLTLTAFVEAADRQMARLFVPFADQTNGPETYQAGRYLDLTRTTTGLYDLDFNRAYHPYCYFNDEYDCPFPPAENRLGIPIRAGERMKDARAAAGS